MFADHLVFVDVETTGTSPQTARVTEVGVVDVRADGEGGWQVDTWSSLVNPQCAIPPEIQFLTGITPAMVADAPRFEELAPALHQRLDGAIFVAHNARFDYGFLKAEFARAGLKFHAKTLCTVRLSRLLDPDRSPHSLDAIIARHRLPAPDRHRALGDARVLWAFIQKVWDSHGAETVQAAARRLLRHPSLPSHLPPDTLQKMPRAPGVYLFAGEGGQPLYIGKSTCLRERVASHFVADHRHERGVRLASEVRTIDWQRTAGELGALLLEARWIRERLPSHNIALRRRLAEVVIALPEAASGDAPVVTAAAAGPVDPASRRPASLKLTYPRLATLSAASLPGHYGPFASRAAARALLLSLCREHRLCAKRLGLERGAADAPCFNRQLGRCDGACIGLQSDQQLRERLIEALAPHRIPPWTTGPIAIREADAEGDGEDWLVFDQWCYLGQASDAAGAQTLIDARRTPADASAIDGAERPDLSGAASPTSVSAMNLQFDTGAYRLVRRVLDSPPEHVVLQPLSARYSWPSDCGDPAPWL